MKTEGALKKEKKRCNKKKEEKRQIKYTCEQKKERKNKETLSESREACVAYQRSILGHTSLPG